jgi:hypothetical protein
MTTTLCKTSMAGPLGVLPVGLAVATTVVEEDVDGRLLGGATGGSSSGHHRRRGLRKLVKVVL